MDHRTRICLLVIVIGLANFLAYTIMYMSLGGDAMNGYVQVEYVRPATAQADHAPPRRVLHYYLVAKGVPFEVRPEMWIYSAVHSISIWVTVGAVLLAMLTLAKDRIVSSMHSSIVRGRTFITILATVVTLISVTVTVWFVIYMVRQLGWPERLGGP